jgi:mRNA interferase RelE/StbE
VTEPPVDDDPYLIKPTSRARRDISRLPEAVAWACLEFITGPLAENPHRVGKALGPPFAGMHSARRGSYRVIYRIDDEDHAVEILHIDHRAVVCRP